MASKLNNAINSHDPPNGYVQLFIFDRISLWNLHTRNQSSFSFQISAWGNRLATQAVERQQFLHLSIDQFNVLRTRVLHWPLLKDEFSGELAKEIRNCEPSCSCLSRLPSFVRGLVAFSDDVFGYVLSCLRSMIDCAHIQQWRRDWRSTRGRLRGRNIIKLEIWKLRQDVFMLLCWKLVRWNEHWCYGNYLKWRHFD